MVAQRSVDAALKKVRAICAQLPDVEERPSHGAPTFFLKVKGKKSFVMFHDDHHGDGRLAIWCRAADGVQAQLVKPQNNRNVPQAIATKFHTDEPRLAASMMLITRIRMPVSDVMIARVWFDMRVTLLLV